MGRGSGRESGMDARRGGGGGGGVAIVCVGRMLWDCVGGGFFFSPSRGWFELAVSRRCGVGGLGDGSIVTETLREQAGVSARDDGVDGLAGRAGGNR